MAKPTKYAVHYGEKIARFSDYDDAMKFARNLEFAEVFHSSGIIAKFQAGRATPEFAHLDRFMADKSPTA